MTARIVKNLRDWPAFRGALEAIAAFIAAAVMLVLGALGLMHSRRVSPDTEILNRRPAPTPAPGTVPVQAVHLNGKHRADDLTATPPAPSGTSSA